MNRRPSFKPGLSGSKDDLNDSDELTEWQLGLIKEFNSRFPLRFCILDKLHGENIVDYFMFSLIKQMERNVALSSHKCKDFDIALTDAWGLNCLCHYTAKPWTMFFFLFLFSSNSRGHL
jgi:hypothetical protein